MTGVSLQLTRVANPRGADNAVSKIDIPQYRLHSIAAIWAAAAVPMAALARLVAPAMAARLSGEGTVPMVKALLVSLTGGLIWQFVLVLALVGREQAPCAGRRSVTRCGFACRAVREVAAPAAGCGPRGRRPEVHEPAAIARTASSSAMATAFIDARWAARTTPKLATSPA